MKLFKDAISCVLTVFFYFSTSDNFLFIKGNSNTCKKSC